VYRQYNKKYLGITKIANFWGSHIFLSGFIDLEVEAQSSPFGA
jgi:hypothetical protein